MSDQDIIDYIIDYINDLWLDDDVFHVYTSSLKIHNIPSIIWKSILKLDILIIQQFPTYDKDFISNLIYFYLVSLSSYATIHPNYTSNNISNFTKEFLNNTFNTRITV